MITEQTADAPATGKLRNTLVPVLAAAALGGVLLLWLTTTGRSPAASVPKPQDTCGAATTQLSSLKESYRETAADSDARTKMGAFAGFLIAENPNCFTADDRAWAAKAAGTTG